MKRPDLLGTWWMGASSVVLGIVCFAFAWLLPPHTVVVAILRAGDRSAPPYEMETDRARVQGLLLEPLCAQPRGVVEVTSPIRPVAQCSQPKGENEDVIVTPRPDLTLGGRRAKPEDVAKAVEAWWERKQDYEAKDGEHALPPWSTINWDGSGVLHFAPAEGTSAYSLRSTLADILVALEEGDCLLGTGPWRQASCLPPKTPPSLSPAWEAVPRVLRESGSVTELTVLERSRWLGLDRYRIVQVGLDYKGISADACEAPEARDAAQASEPLDDQARAELLACVIERALSGEPGERLDLVRGIEGDMVRRLKGARESRALRGAPSWDLLSMVGDRVMWAVANPDLDPAHCERLVAIARKVANDPAFYTVADGTRAASLLPGVFEPAHFAPPPAEELPPLPAAAPTLQISDADALPQGCPSTPEEASRALLTHSFWARVGERFLERAGDDSGLNLVVLPVKEESACRSAGSYGLSLLSVATPATSHPATVLSVSASIWFGEAPADGPAKDAAELAHRELADPMSVSSEELGEILAGFDSYIVPLNAPPTWFALHRDLLGWDVAARQLDPEAARLRDAFLPNAGWFGLASLITGLLMLGTTALYRRDRERRQMLLYRDISAFHHDLSSPLTTIRAEADHLRERVASAQSDQELAAHLREVAELVDLEAQIAHSMVDDLQVAANPASGIAFEAGQRCDLVGEALLPELTRLEQRARLEGVELELERRLPTEARAVAVGPRAAQRVVQNLLDNALKYRLPGSRQARVRVDVRLSEEGVDLEMSDWGIGFDEELSPSAFFELRQRGRRDVDRAVRGQGLGLATVERIVNAAGGRVEISNYAKPSSVRVWLPYAQPGRRS